MTHRILMGRFIKLHAAPAFATVSGLACALLSWILWTTDEQDLVVTEFLFNLSMLSQISAAIELASVWADMLDGVLGSVEPATNSPSNFSTIAFQSVWDMTSARAGAFVGLLMKRRLLVHISLWASALAVMLPSAHLREQGRLHDADALVSVGAGLVYVIALHAVAVPLYTSCVVVFEQLEVFIKNPNSAGAAKYQRLSLKVAAIGCLTVQAWASVILLLVFYAIPPLRDLMYMNVRGIQIWLFLALPFISLFNLPALAALGLPTRSARTKTSQVSKTVTTSAAPTASALTGIPPSV
eukprot:TRINITY_DN705_c0_g1_i4.p1 TRINITY_DN705_c0_g1~~TRINITY_DN705_c0_g1_i4.p1  ORF type:complete len:297 (-),score=49.82 TRINITY_DN705_c0_g1_i4:21-911(-)